MCGHIQDQRPKQKHTKNVHEVKIHRTAKTKLTHQASSPADIGSCSTRQIKVLFYSDITMTLYPLPLSACSLLPAVAPSSS